MLDIERMTTNNHASGFTLHKLLTTQIQMAARIPQRIAPNRSKVKNTKSVFPNRIGNRCSICSVCMIAAIAASPGRTARTVTPNGRFLSMSYLISYFLSGKMIMQNRFNYDPPTIKLSPQSEGRRAYFVHNHTTLHYMASIHSRNTTFYHFWHADISMQSGYSINTPVKNI